MFRPIYGLRKKKEIGLINNFVPAINGCGAQLFVKYVMGGIYVCIVRIHVEWGYYNLGV